MLRGSRADDRSRLASLRADPDLRRRRARLWRPDPADGPGRGGRHRPDARDRRRRAGRRDGVSQSPVHDHRRRRHRRLRPALDLPGLPRRLRLPDRRAALGCRRLHRHERVGPGQRAHRGGRQARTGAGARGRVSRRRGHRHAGGGTRAARRLDLLRHSLLVLCRRPGLGPGGPRRPRGAARAQLRRLADLDLRPPGRRHLHQGRRRRRRSGRQDRGRHPRGRSAQSGGDRGQCRRQCRRLRRHGGRSVRDLRRHRGRDHAARRDLLHGRGADRADAVSADRRRHLPARLGDRHLHGQARPEQQHHGGAVQGLPRGGHRLGGGAAAGHPAVPGRQHGLRGRWCQLHRLGRIRLHAGRPAGHRLPDVDHRLLHRHDAPAGAEDRRSLQDRPRDQHHRRPRGVDGGDGAAGDRDLRRHPPGLPVGRPVRHRRGGHDHAGADRPGGLAGRLRAR